ncbi:MAG: tRNA (N(6)-L-threonylcarbamoyladenosine(37)-C(2))-methylthiotransferase MtaB [Candidatus Sulfotelmatobacter sp.]
MDHVPAFHVENFGCRATQADGAALEHQFEERGLDRAPAADADVVILNTCTVTAAADQDARAAIRRVQRQNPNAKIIVTGCYAQRAPEEIAALPGVTCVVGNSHKHQLAEIALPRVFAERDRNKRSQDEHEQAEHEREGHDFSRAISAAFSPALAAEVSPTVHLGSFIPLTSLASRSREPKLETRIFVSDIFAHTELLAAPVFDLPGDADESQRTRPNLKVQDGCDNRCSFCVIPYVRGQSRSLPLPQILREVNALVDAGYREVVVSGINLGRWGRDLARAASAFEDLLRAILSETSLEKLRISSVEPMDWTDDLISLVAESPRIAKHAHVPLQSGSDAVLRRMHRKYRPWHYREKIEKIRAAMPPAAIGADVMVGFPGETDAEFEATRRLIEHLSFTYLHVFTYSARPGTPAASMPNQVPVHVARERSRILRDLADEKKRAFMRSFIGKTVEAITLRSCGAGTLAREGSGTNDDKRGISFPEDRAPFTEALTDNYLKLHLKGHHEPNRWLRAHVELVEDGALVASRESDREAEKSPV